MPKSFPELSSRQKNRRLQAYEKHERQSILHRVNTPIINTGVASLESLADINVPIRQCILPDNSNSNNALNIYSTDVANSDVHHVEEGASSDVYHAVVKKSKDKENEENINKTLEFSNWLCSWTLKHNITHTALSELLNKLHTWLLRSTKECKNAFKYTEK